MGWTAFSLTFLVSFPCVVFVVVPSWFLCHIYYEQTARHFFRSLCLGHSANLVQPELGTLWFPWHCLCLLRQHPISAGSEWLWRQHPAQPALCPISAQIQPSTRSKAVLAVLKSKYHGTEAKKSHPACLVLMFAAWPWISAQLHELCVLLLCWWNSLSDQHSQEGGSYSKQEAGIDTLGVHT